MKGRILPSGNKEEFPILDKELAERNVDCIIIQVSSGARIYFIPDGEICKLPKYERVPYLGDDESGHSIYNLCFIDVVEIFPSSPSLKELTTYGKR